MEGALQQTVVMGSLAALRAEHGRLLAARRGIADGPVAPDIIAFIRRGVALGAFLNTDAERASAQGLLDYWANVLDRAGADYEDATLSDFDPDALAAAAERAYGAWRPDEQAMAKRVVQALAQAAPAGSGSAGGFGPLTRADLGASSDTPDQAEALDRAIQRMLGAGWLTARPPVASDRPAQLELALPALARFWPPMLGWVAEVSDRIDKRYRLALAAQQWQLLGRNPSALRRGALLDIAVAFTDLNPLESAFVRESLEAERTDAQARQAAQARELEAARKLAAESQLRANLELRRLGEVRRRNRALAGAAALLVVLVFATAYLAWLALANAPVCP